MKIVKNQLCRKIAVLCAVTVLAVAFGGTTAKAASSVSGTLNGAACSGRVSTNSTSAIATTTYGRGNSTIKAIAKVYYKKGTKYYNTTSSANSSAGGATATAAKKVSGATVVGGSGMHGVVYGSLSWAMPTTTGTIPSSSTAQ